MKTKKKVIIALSSLAVVFVAAIVAVVAVFAARTTTTNSGFTITYTAIQVKATISGTYKVNTDASPTALSPASISFDGTEATDGTANVKSFNSVTVPLTASGSETEKYIDFVYTIVNNHTTDSMDIALASDPDAANDNLTYHYSATNGGTPVSNPTYNNLVTGLAHGATAVITIRVQVTDLDSNVNATGNFAFVLTKTGA
ncbi:MAG: hypothetical protein IJS68_03745 [Clostridia bacterium]|nr:hypothetical protein [Clostridia bacterium]